MPSNREWTTHEIAVLKRNYPKGVPVAVIAQQLSRTRAAIRVKARKLGLVHPAHSSRQAIANFEALHGQSISDIARRYRDTRISRTTLARDIGIDRESLRNALGHDLWQSWPHMTIGRIDAVRQRSTAA